MHLRVVNGYDLSEPARGIWGKAGDLSSGWLPLWRHLADSAEVAALLWDLWLPAVVRRRISQELPGGEADGRRLVRWLAGTHDLGKATPAFAYQQHQLATRMRGLGFEFDARVAADRRLAPHALAGQAVLGEWLERRHGWQRWQTQPLTVVVGGHHGTPPTDLDLDQLRGHGYLLGWDGLWSQTREELLDWAFGADRLLVLRPHVVLGRYEYVGRLPWWLGRMRRGGKVLAPAPDRGIQPVDVRDLVGFLLDQVERGGHGIFNVAAPPGAAGYGDLLRACAAVTATVAELPAELVWVDEDWLVDQEVTQWTELPLWRNAVAPWGLNVDRALAAGLRCRPVAETVADTWSWLRDGGRPVAHERFAEHGIAPAREAALIWRWLRRSETAP